MMLDLYLFAAIISMASGKQGSGNEYTGELRIGIKKRATDCSIRASAGDVLTVHYVGQYYSTNQVFDSSRERGVPITFNLGELLTLKGFETGLIGACEGEIRKLTIPPSLARADDPDNHNLMGFVPQNEAIVYEVEVMKIVPVMNNYYDSNSDDEEF